jgi:hypothetical protein
MGFLRVLALFIVAVTMAGAETRTFRNNLGGDNLFSNTKNWAGNILPVAGDDVVIHQACGAEFGGACGKEKKKRKRKRRLTILPIVGCLVDIVPPLLKSLTIESDTATHDCPGALSIAGKVTLRVDGPVVLKPHAKLSFTAPSTIVGTTLTVEAEAVISGSGSLNFTAGVDLKPNSTLLPGRFPPYSCNGCWSFMQGSEQYGDLIFNAPVVNATKVQFFFKGLVWSPFFLFLLRVSDVIF